MHIVTRCVDRLVTSKYDGPGSSMKRFGLIVGVVGVVGASEARAEDPDTIPGISEQAPGITPEGALAPISVVEGAGIKVGEGTVLHPIVGLETGYVSNVFYEEGSERGAGIMRLIAQIGTGSLSPQRLAVSGTSPDDTPIAQENQGSFIYRADLRLSYDLYLSGSDTISSQNGLGVGALFRGHVYPKRTWSFLYLENFQRIIRATNFESRQQTNRDINRLQLGLQLAPVGRSMQGLLHYENTLDYFEDEDQQFANRLQHQIGLTYSWRFRPYTVFFADYTQGLFGGLGGKSVKNDAYPLTITAGVQTLLSLTTTVVGRVGYTNGLYAAGPSYSTVVGGVELGWRYAYTGRVTALYDYSHHDSINANFYRDHTFRVLFEQQMRPLTLTLQPELRLRRYEGIMQVVPTAPDTREDVIAAVSAGARYNLRDWFAMVAEYRFTAIETDFRYMSGSVSDDPSYARHEILVGVRAAL